MKLHEVLVSKLSPSWSHFGCPKCDPKCEEGYFLIQINGCNGEWVYLCPNCLTIYDIEPLKPEGN